MRKRDKGFCTNWLHWTRENWFKFSGKDHTRVSLQSCFFVLVYPCYRFLSLFQTSLHKNLSHATVSLTFMIRKVVVSRVIESVKETGIIMKVGVMMIRQLYCRCHLPFFSDLRERMCNYCSGGHGWRVDVRHFCLFAPTEKRALFITKCAISSEVT